KEADNLFSNIFSSIHYDSLELLEIDNLILIDINETVDAIEIAIIDGLKYSEHLEEYDGFIKSIKENEFILFSQMVAAYSKINVVTAKKLLRSFKDVTCSCDNFVKNKKCRHVFKYFASKNKTEFLELTLLRANKKRGRPSLKIKANASLSRK
ncbi:hypothetical protein H311_04543, partial [Anncaliia algerae PRA109]